MNLLIESWKNQFFSFFFWLHYFFFFFIPNFLFFYHLFQFHNLFPFIFSFSYFHSLLVSYPFSFFPLISFGFTISIFLVLVFTTFHTPLDILSSWSLLFSSQSQDCGEQAIVFLRLHSIFVFLLYQFLFSLYVLCKIYLLSLYILLFFLY